MNKDYILENNKLIAEFMGMQSTDIGWFDSEGLLCQHIYDETGGNCHDNLNFNKSWDWLMPVVDKIFSSDNYSVYVNTTSGQFENSIHINTKFIKSTYVEVIEFIKWYNENI